MRWAGHVVFMKHMRGVYIILDEMSEGEIIQKAQAYMRR
jgi:hypothetical protein